MNTYFVERSGNEKLFRGIFVLLFLAPSAKGESCNLEIRDGYAARDLSRILNCLQEKINNNEIEILDLKGRLSTCGKISDPESHRTDKFEATVRGASKQDTFITVGLAIKNTTTEKFFIATENNKSVLIDEQTGNSFPVRTQSGLNEVYASNKDEQSYTPVLPNSHVNFSMSFCSDVEKISKSSLNSLNLCLLTLSNAKVAKNSIPLRVVLKTN
jgi:glucan-binding YG repeat protein